jgi:hypothetical protein
LIALVEKVDAVAELTNKFVPMIVPEFIVTELIEFPRIEFPRIDEAKSCCVLTIVAVTVLA